MSTFICFYKNQKFVVNAESKYAAQKLAATHFRTKKPWDIAIVLADIPLDTASL